MFYDNSATSNEELTSFKNINYICFGDNLPKYFHNKIKRAFIKWDLVNKKILDKSVNLLWNYDLQTNDKTKHVMYIHDLLQVEYPNWFDKSFYNSTKTSLDFAASRSNSLVICNSHYTASVYEKIYPNSHSKTKVVYPAIRESFFDNYEKNRADYILKKYDLKYKKFIVSYGFIDPRKNILRQVEAFQKIIATEKFKNFKYVLIGPQNIHSQKIMDKIFQSKLSKNICFLDYVSQFELELIIKNSLGVSYCSLAEGFGLPIIEAMAAKVPVLTSNTT